MNGLSIIIYLANVLPSLIPLFAIFGGSIVAASVFCFVSGKLVPWTYYSWNKPSDIERMENGRKLLGKISIPAFIIGFFMLTISALIPSEKTIYMIAASELGETVVTHPDVVEVYDELRDIVLDKLKEYKQNN